VIVAVIGCGSWGSRVARRLAEFDDVIVSAVMDADRDRARSVARELPTWDNGGCTTEAQVDALDQYLDVMTPDAVVLAVPPAQRGRLVDVICAAKRPPRLRVEKPLAQTAEEAHAVARRCAATGVPLTIGFTLLHHPLYEVAFDYLAAIQEPVERVVGVRVGRTPAHDVHAQLDLGVHTASIAAHLGIGRRHTDIVAMHAHGAGARTTRIVGMRGAVVTVDELALTVSTPHGVIHVGDTHDALGRDLRAWIDGTHRGSVEVALSAQRIVDAHIAGTQGRVATRELTEVAA
jgi:predicted dehydrogenase